MASPAVGSTAGSLMNWRTADRLVAGMMIAFLVTWAVVNSSTFSSDVSLDGWGLPVSILTLAGLCAIGLGMNRRWAFFMSLALFALFGLGCGSGIFSEANG